MEKWERLMVGKGERVSVVKEGGLRVGEGDRVRGGGRVRSGKRGV